MSDPNLLSFVKELNIVTKDARVAKLKNVMTNEQRAIVDHFEKCIRDRKPTRIITLKARQMGISTITEALMFSLCFAIPRMQGLVVSHSTDSAKHLLRMTRNYWDTFWAKNAYTPQNLAVNHMSWRETKSSIRVATAGNGGTGRSQTIQFLHASEVAFWPHPAELMKGLNQAIPSDTHLSFIVMESTAHGVGNYFYKQWHAAQNGESDYTPFFFPWWKFPSYTAEAIGWQDVPLTQLDEEERTLKAYLATQNLSPEDIDSRLRWRRYAIPNLCNNDLLAFHQEYPAHPEEAFIATGDNVFSVDNLNKCYQPMDGMRGYLMRFGNEVRFFEDPNGELTVFSRPSPDVDWGQYVAFADPARSAGGGSDYAVIQVLNRRTWEQVAMWRGHIEPATLAEKLIEVGLYYNMALVNCENTGPGHATIGWLLAKNYPYVWETQKFWQHPKYNASKFGWESNHHTKQAMVAYLRKAVTEGTITIHSRRTYAEMKNYVVIDDGFGNADEEDYDDCVTSLTGALITVITTATDLGPHIPAGPLEKPVSHAPIDPTKPFVAPHIAEDLPEKTEWSPDEDDVPEWMAWEDGAADHI